MITTLERDLFLRSIQKTQRALSSRNTLPVLGGILLEAKDNSLTAQATDLEISIKNTVEARVEKEGRVVVLGDLLSNLVKNLEEGKIRIALNRKENKVNISSGNSNFNLNTLPVEDFPPFPKIESKKSIKIKNEELVDVVRQVVVSVSKDESRPALTGVYVVAQDKKLTLVSTDSYRLSLKDIKTTGSEEERITAPKRAIEEALRVSPGEGETEIIFSEKQVGFKREGFLLISRLIGGQYPNFIQLFPKNFKTEICIKKEEFVRALKRIALVSSGSPITITVKNKKITIRGRGANTGTGEEEAPSSTKGEDTEVSFNSKYLIEGIEAVGGEEATIYLNDPFQPGLIKGNKTENYKHLIMPVRQN